MVIKSESIKATNKIAKELAEKISVSKPKKTAVVLALEGELGAGKTTFTQAFAKALNAKGKITSPTFVLLKSYPIKNRNFKSLIHIDAYRLNDWRDLIPLHIEEIMANPENLVLIEWPERIRPILPAKYIRVHIDHLSPHARKISIT
jgi:tRNA threonylcarbamoyladenosine biosynthesis protein TsaE